MKKKFPNNVNISLNFSEETILDQTNIYFNLLCMLCINRFEWHNLPDEIDSRFLELTLMRNGRAVFFYDEAYGYMCLPFTDRGELNYYMYPTKVSPYAIGGYNFPDLALEECVLIYNDTMHTTPLLTITTYTQKLTNVSTSLDVNSAGLRSPVIGLCEESQKYTFEQLFDKVSDGKPRILGAKNLDLNNINMFPTISQPLVDSVKELRDYKRDIWFEALTYLGIENADTSKRERLLTNEVNSNNAEVQVFKALGLATRQRACQQINEMYGLNVSVSHRTDTLRDATGAGQDGVQRSEPDTTTDNSEV